MDQIKWESPNQLKVGLTPYIYLYKEVYELLKRPRCVRIGCVEGQPIIVIAQAGEDEPGVFISKTHRHFSALTLLHRMALKFNNGKYYRGVYEAEYNEEQKLLYVYLDRPIGEVKP